MKVNKPWGHEIWLEDGTSTPYSMKRILFLEGNRTSLQVHRYKLETTHVIRGAGILYISKNTLDIDKFLTEGMSTKQVQEYEKNMIQIDIVAGDTFTIRPGIVHRVVSVTDLEIIETSTTELDDVYRLQDDTGRTHGKITSEHQ